MRIYYFLLVSLMLSCSSKKELVNASLVIKNVNILNVRDGSYKNDQNIYIGSGKIVKISDEDEPHTKGAKIIDGTNKYVMPGLAEMHAHIPTESAWGGEVENTLFLYLSQGITTIRGMQGNPLHLQLKIMAAQNEILSPRIFTASPPLNGSTVKSKEEADTKVRMYEADGYDLLKILPGIELEVFDQIIETANEVGIPYAGHVPVKVGVRHALESKYASIDHMDGFLTGLVPGNTDVNREETGFFGYAFTPLADTSLISELVEKSRENGVWVVPTQTLFTRWFSPRDPEKYAAEPEMKYMPKETIDNWIKSKTRLIGDESYNENQWSRYISLRNQLLLALHRNGQGLILGSDAPQVFNVPGFSIHHELQDMLDVGLTPLEVIQMGTLNPAKYFNMEGMFGEVIVNASADLILLNDDPLGSLEVIKDHEGVVVRGQWLDKDEISQKLTEIPAP